MTTSHPTIFVDSNLDLKRTHQGPPVIPQGGHFKMERKLRTLHIIDRYIIACMSTVLTFVVAYGMVTMRTSPSDILREVKSQAAEIKIYQERNNENIKEVGKAINAINEQMEIRGEWMENASRELGIDQPRKIVLTPPLVIE